MLSTDEKFAYLLKRGAELEEEDSFRRRFMSNTASDSTTTVLWSGWLTVESVKTTIGYGDTTALKKKVTWEVPYEYAPQNIVLGSRDVTFETG